MDAATSRDLAAEVNFSTSVRAKSWAVPAPREVMRLPSMTTRWSARMAGSSEATEKWAVYRRPERRPASWRMVGAAQMAASQRPAAA